MHEWKETFGYNPHTGKYDVEGKTHSPTTWIFEAGSFVPCGKITNGKHYSIITDHLGTPIEAYNQEGELIWEREQDLYGNSRQGFAKENFRCPFKYQGQYYDPEIELCYNRFRYYHPEIGRYISEDPIKLLGGFNVFAYVSDSNAWVDLLGLSSWWYYARKFHDDEATKIFGEGKGKRLKDRVYDKEYDGKDIEFKSANFKRERTQSEIDHMNKQIDKDIKYKQSGEANPHWHFLNDPKGVPDMEPILKRLKDNGIEYSSGSTYNNNK